MNEEQFFERLRGDAASLRHEPDPFTLARIRAGIQERVARPTVAQLLAAWFRPLAATLGAIAIAAAIGMNAIETNDDTAGDTSVEIVMAGETYSVSE